LPIYSLVSSFQIGYNYYKGGDQERERDGESQLQNKRDRLTILRVSNAAEKKEPQLQKKSG